MMTLNEHDEFIAENVQKFHELINSPELDATTLKDALNEFYTELFIRASEANGYDGHIIFSSQVEIDMLSAIFMSAFDIYARFCDEFDELYPDESKYFGRDVVTKSFVTFFSHKDDKPDDEVIEPDPTDVSILPAMPMNPINMAELQSRLQGKDE